MAGRREHPQHPWDDHRQHVPEEFEQAGRRGWYRTRGGHATDEQHEHDPRWPGRPGQLGPHPVDEHDRGGGARTTGRQGYARDGERPARQPFDGTAARAPTSGYDDYEAESLYGEAFREGDWPRTWRDASGDRPASPRPNDHRGRGPQGYRRSDQRILDDVHERLTDDPYVDARGLKLSIEQGVVCIEGEVAQRWIKHHVEHVAARCAGVCDVDNRVRVRRAED